MDQLLSRPPAVLVVSPSPDLLCVLERVVCRVVGESYGVVTAYSGNEASVRAVLWTVRVAIVDGKLEDMDGLNLIVRLRALDPEMRAILMVTFPTQELELRAQAMDVIYLPKPFELETIEDLFRVWLKP